MPSFAAWFGRLFTGNKEHTMDNDALTNFPYLIVGLGNPGREYRQNRHNVGFMLVDCLAERLGVTFSRVESKALVTKADYQGKRIVLAKPQTYMNLSGQAVGALMRFYKVPVENFMVSYDDVDLPLGTLRLRPDGGSAGNKGMISSIERLGTQVFPRMRVGIGRPPGKMDPVDFVLQEFTKAEKDQLQQVLDRARQAVCTYIASGLETAMNQFNGLVKE
jgi:PTH1 family peptidyl-tRNA hydrolase